MGLPRFLGAAALDRPPTIGVSGGAEHPEAGLPSAQQSDIRDVGGQRIWTKGPSVPTTAFPSPRSRLRDGPIRPCAAVTPRKGEAKVRR